MRLPREIIRVTPAGEGTGHADLIGGIVSTDMRLIGDWIKGVNHVFPYRVRAGLAICRVRATDSFAFNHGELVLGDA